MMRCWLLLILLCSSLSLQAQSYRHSAVDEIVAAAEAPEGVVFDLVSWEDHSWDWAAPMLQSLTGQLWQHYPALEIALVSHGFELFDLSERSGNTERQSIQQLQRLAEAGLDVHICGRYASTRFFQPEAFLPFVDFAASGEAQIEDYIKLGFVRVGLGAPDGVD